MAIAGKSVMKEDLNPAFLKLGVNNVNPGYSVIEIIFQEILSKDQLGTGGCPIKKMERFFYLALVNVVDLALQRKKRRRNKTKHVT